MNIEWKSEILAKEGYGVIARELLNSIKDNIKITPKEDYVSPDNKLSDSPYIQSIIKSVIKPDSDLVVNFCIPNLYEVHKDKINVGLSLWDSDLLHPSWAMKMAEMDAILVPNDFMLNAVQKMVNKPVYLFKPGFNLEDWKAEGEKIEISETEGKIKYIFDGQWNILSDIERMITGFCVAFRGVEDACLILKLSSEENADKRKAVAAGVQSFLEKLIDIKKRPKIVILTDQLDHEEKKRLYRGMHYFLDISRMENISFTKWRAKHMGIPVIGMAKSGNREVSDLIVDSHFDPITGVRVNLLDSNQKWEVANTDSLIETLEKSYQIIKNNQYKELSDLARSRAEERNNKTDLIEVLTRIYNETKK